MATIINFEEYKRKAALKAYFDTRKKALKNIEELSDLINDHQRAGETE